MWVRAPSYFLFRLGSQADTFTPVSCDGTGVLPYSEAPKGIRSLYEHLGVRTRVLQKLALVVPRADNGSIRAENDRPDGRRPAGDLGFGADVFRYAEGMLEQFVQMGLVAPSSAAVE